MREVPELMERTPQEARERWLRLTGRLSAGGGEGGSGREGGEVMAGSPALDKFYIQVGLNGSQAVCSSLIAIDYRPRHIFVGNFFIVCSSSPVGSQV